MSPTNDAATAAYAVTTTYAGTVNAALPAANFVAPTNDDDEQDDTVSTIDETKARDVLLTGGVSISDAASEDVADSIAVEAASRPSASRMSMRCCQTCWMTCHFEKSEDWN